MHAAQKNKLLFNTKGIMQMKKQVEKTEITVKITAKKTGNTEKTEKPSSKRLFIIFTSVFMSLVLLFGAVFGTVTIVRNSRAVLKYKNTLMPEGVARYLAASYKYDYLAMREGVDKSDTASFWSSMASGGMTYGDILTERTDKYLKAVLVGSYLFDKNTSLSESDKAKIDNYVDEIVTYRADGSREKFNELAEPCGFDLDDFRRAMEMIYKYETAKTVIFGFDGYSLSQGGYTTECENYLEGYTHVKLMFIRTDEQYVMDNETGKLVSVELSAEQVAAQYAKIEHIRELIANASYEGTSGTGGAEMTPSYFENYAREELRFFGSGETAVDYYFRLGTSFTGWYLTAEGDVDSGNGTKIVNKSLEIGIGEYAEIETDFGACFIYRDEVERGAYSQSTYEDFFSDFYSKLSDHIYERELLVYIEDVTEKKKYSRLDFIGTPYITF